MTIITVLKFAIAAFFLVHALLKIGGYKGDVELFAKIGFGQVFRYFTGLVEAAGAGLLVFAATPIWGVLILLGVMAGATLTQIQVLGNRRPFQEAAISAMLIILAISA